MPEDLTLVTHPTRAFPGWPGFDEYYLTSITGQMETTAQPFTLGYLQTALCRDLAAPFLFFVDLHVYPLYRNRRVGKTLMQDRMATIAPDMFGMLINDIPKNPDNAPGVYKMYENLEWKPYKSRSVYLTYNPNSIDRGIIKQAARRIGDRS